MLTKFLDVLTTILATSCSAERSFSARRRMKTYLRSIMDQERLNSIAIVNTERALANKTLNDDMQRIIDNFGERHNRSSFFLKHWIPD